MSETRNHTTAHKIINRHNTLEITFDLPIKISEPNPELRDAWIQRHLVLESERDLHHMVVPERGELEIGRQRNRDERIPLHRTGDSVNRNSNVLIDVTELVQPPQKMVLHIGGVERIVRLKSFDYFRRL